MYTAGLPRAGGSYGSIVVDMGRLEEVIIIEGWVETQSAINTLMLRVETSWFNSGPSEIRVGGVNGLTNNAFEECGVANFHWRADAGEGTLHTTDQWYDYRMEVVLGDFI